MEALRVLSRGVDGTTLTIYKGLSDEFTKDCYFKNGIQSKGTSFVILVHLKRTMTKRLFLRALRALTAHAAL